MSFILQKVDKDSSSLHFLYETVLGRILLKPLVSRTVSIIAGKYLDSSLSKWLIKPFIENNHIDINEYMVENYQCFNDCFSRRIKKENRPIDTDKTHFISPCDGYLSVYTIDKDTILPIKQSSYTLSSLLQDEQLAREYEDGLCFVFRLCVNHYHRYCYLDDGSKGKNTFIEGKLHTVRPIALKNNPVFVENCREYTVMDTKNIGKVIQIEVGAMLVGKIRNNHEEYTFVRGEEKGCFLYGGSTIIVLVKKDKVILDDIFYKSNDDQYEIPVKMGECLGTIKQDV